METFLQGCLSGSLSLCGLGLAANACCTLHGNQGVPQEIPGYRPGTAWCGRGACVLSYTYFVSFPLDNVSPFWHGAAFPYIHLRVR